MDGWMDGMEDLRTLGVVNWKKKAQEWVGWRKVLEQAKDPQRVVVPMMMILLLLLLASISSSQT
jgi:hypothetical protein